MKKNHIFTALCISAVLAVVPVFAEEAAEEPASAQSYVTDQSPFCGVWSGRGYVGDNYYRIGGTLFVMPDMSITVGDTSGTCTEVDDSHVAFASEMLPEGVSVTAEVGTISQEELDTLAGGKSDVAVGGARLLVTVTHPGDNKNPLAAASEAETVSLFIKNVNQADYLKALLTGKTWKIGDHTLTIDQDGNMSLDDGSVTGSTYFSRDSDKGIDMYVEFRWSTGGHIIYFPSKITADSVALVNIDDPSEVQLLTLDGTAPAPSADAAEETAEDTEG